MRAVHALLIVLSLAFALPLVARAGEPAPVAAPVSPAPAAAVQAAAPEQKKAEPSPATPTVRIGYLDMAKIGNESVSGKAAQAQFKAKADKYKAQITAKQKQLEKQKADIEAKLPSLLPEQRAAKAKEFEKKVEEYRRFVQKAEKELKPLEEELTRSLLGEIDKVVTDYGKSKGFVAIVAKRELLYQGSDVAVQDVTEDVLKLVNAKAEKK